MNTTNPIGGQDPGEEASMQVDDQLSAFVGQDQSAAAASTLLPIGQATRSNDSFASAASASTTPMELDPPRRQPASVLGRRRFTPDDEDEYDAAGPSNPGPSGTRRDSQEAEARARSRSRHLDNLGEMEAARAFVETREARLLREQFMKATGRRQPRQTRMRVRAWCCGCRAEQRFHSDCLCYSCGHERCNDCLLGPWEPPTGIGGV